MVTCSFFKKNIKNNNKKKTCNALFSDNILDILPHEVICNWNIVSQSLYFILPRYVGNVMVQDLQTEQKWHFLCNSWLAIDLGDCSPDKEFSVSTEMDLKKFRWGWSIEVLDSEIIRYDIWCTAFKPTELNVKLKPYVCMEIWTQAPSKKICQELQFVLIKVEVRKIKHYQINI